MPPALRRVLPALLVSVLAAALCTDAALARDTEKTWELGGFTTVTRFSQGTNIDTGIGWGARGGYHVKANQEFEGSVDLLSADDRKVSGLTYDVTKIRADFLHIFFIKGHEKMIPFVSFGTGTVNVDNGSASDSSWLLGFGGGFKYWVKPRGGFRLDVKMSRWHGDGAVVSRDSFYLMDVTLAATFLLGGGK